MIRLPVEAVEACIMAAYYQYLTSTQGPIFVNTCGYEVEVTCVIRGHQFDCGFPGYDMACGDQDALREWCTTHPGDGWSFGFRGADERHPNTVNVVLINKTPLMFNFHVNLG